MNLVYSVLAANSFIGNNRKRAELFEITDNEVPTIKITLPSEEFETLKEIGGRGYCLYLPDKVVSLNNLKGLKGLSAIDLKLVSTLNYNAFQQAEFETKNATMVVDINGYEFI